MKPRTSGSSSITSTEAAGRSGCGVRRVLGRGDRFAGRFRSRRAEEELDRGAFARRAFDPRRAARLARHAVDHRQAEPGALADLLGGEEGLERAGGDVLGHSGAGVADGQLDIAAVVELGVAADLDLAGGEGQHSAVGHGVAGVDGEVEHGDLELGRVGHHRQHLLVEVEALLDARAEHVAQQRAHVLDQRRDVGRPHLEPLDPAERQQLAGQPRPALGRRQRVLGIALELGVLARAWR